MGRVVLVSNRVLDLRKAAQAGGVAVALADIVRTRQRCGSAGTARSASRATASAVSARGTHRHRPALREPITRATIWATANSVLWPVFHNRLDLAQFEAGFFERYVDVNRRLAALLQPLLRPDDIIWVHDYHLIPFATELRKPRRAEPHRLLPAHSVPALADVHGHPRASAAGARARRL